MSGPPVRGPLSYLKCKQSSLLPDASVKSEVYNELRLAATEAKSRLVGHPESDRLPAAGSISEWPVILEELKKSAPLRPWLYRVATNA